MARERNTESRNTEISTEISTETVHLQHRVQHHK